MDKYLTNNESGYRKSWIYILLFFVIAIVSFWPISLHIFSLKNDALNYFLPIRRFVSESYSHNTLPLWTPYLNLGFPLHGDMQSGAWNPFVQIFSLFGPYTLYTLQLETLLYIFLSGVGMFFLLKHLTIHPYANIIVSVAYMLSGYNIDSCQFPNWIASTALLPFVFLFYYRCLTEKTISSGILTGFFLFLFFNCAYPADFIITIYLLAAMLLLYVVNILREKEKLFQRKLIVNHLLLLLFFLLLSSPALLSYFESLPLQERGTGASYRQAMTNPLSPHLLSSFTTPLSTWKMPFADNTDPLERNSWIGIAAFLFVIAGFASRQKEKLVVFSRWAILFFLLFSFGELGGIRIICYFTLPLMDSFRHPANAKMFTIFFCCLLAGFTFNSVLKGQFSKRVLKNSFWITIIILIAILIISLFFPRYLLNPASLSKLFHYQPGVSLIEHVKNASQGISFADLVIISTCIQIPFLWFIYKYLFKKISYRSVTITAIINCVIFAILLQPFTVIKKDKAAFVQDIINAHVVNGYPIPDLHSSLLQNSKDNEKLMDKIGCLNLYNKRIGRSDYRISPNNLLSQNEFWFTEGFRNKIMQNPFIYSPNHLSAFSTWKNNISDSLSTYAYTQEQAILPSFDELSSATINLKSFSPQRIEGQIKSSGPCFVVIQQNIYPRWKLYLDGKEMPLIKTNLTFMGFYADPGQHAFLLRYEATDLKIAFFISLLSLLFIIIYSIWSAINARKHLPK